MYLGACVEKWYLYVCRDVCMGVCIYSSSRDVCMGVCIYTDVCVKGVSICKEICVCGCVFVLRGLCVSESCV